MYAAELKLAGRKDSFGDSNASDRAERSARVDGERCAFAGDVLRLLFPYCRREIRLIARLFLVKSWVQRSCDGAWV